MPYKNKSIAEQGGLRVKLDDERALHRGFGWREFDIFASTQVPGTRDKGIPKTVIAALMGVSPRTVYEWLRLRSVLVAEESPDVKEP